MNSNLVIKRLTKTLLLFIFVGIIIFCLIFLYNVTLKTDTVKEEKTSELKKRLDQAKKKTTEESKTPTKEQKDLVSTEEVSPSNEQQEATPPAPETLPTSEEKSVVSVAEETPTIVETYSQNETEVESLSTTTEIGLINEIQQEIEEIPVEEAPAEEKTETEKKTTTSSSTSKKKTTTSTPKNGWVKEGTSTYYYKNGKKVKNTYIDLIYVNKEGKKTAKVGSFTATLYGARAWTNQTLNIRKQAKKDSQLLGTVPSGKKVTILSDENATTKYIKIKYGNQIGYVYSDYLLINLPDIMPNLEYEITNADQSIYKSASFPINNVTGKNLYGFKAEYNQKIGKESFYAPLLYPIAKQLQKASTLAKKQNYNLKIYDTYRPYRVTTKIYTNFSSLYNSNKTVKQKVNYDKNGNNWGPSWFLAKNYSSHNRGIALDLALTTSDGVELKAQSPMHTLDTSSIVSHNNSVSNRLKEIMTKAGFETLASEWWHFEEKEYQTSPVNDFLLK